MSRVSFSELYFLKIERFSLLIKNNVLKLKKVEKNSYNVIIIFLKTERYSLVIKKIFPKLKKEVN